MEHAEVQDRPALDEVWMSASSTVIVLGYD
jgi:hypothetical protein